MLVGRFVVSEFVIDVLVAIVLLKQDFIFEDGLAGLYIDDALAHIVAFHNGIHLAHELFVIVL